VNLSKILAISNIDRHGTCCGQKTDMDAILRSRAMERFSGRNASPCLIEKTDNRQLLFQSSMIDSRFKSGYCYIWLNGYMRICGERNVQMPDLLEFFKLVSDETRLRMVVLLAQEDLYVCQISGILNLSQPKVSKHLSKLRNLGYVIDERREKYILYSLNLKDEVIEKVVQSLIENIEKYPVLSEDRERLTDKQIHLSRCVTRLPK